MLAYSLLQTLTATQLKDLSQQLVQDALDKGDAGASKQIIKSTVKALATANAGRRLGSSSALDNQVVRASLLVNLISTYAITPITTDDTASILSLLADILSQPSEVSVATATSAQTFYLTVLGGSTAAGLGLTGAAATSALGVAAALSNIALLSPATVTATSAATLLANVIAAGAAQLKGSPGGAAFTTTASGLSLESYRSLGQETTLQATLSSTGTVPPTTLATITLPTASSALASLSSTDLWLATVPNVFAPLDPATALRSPVVLAQVSAAETSAALSISPATVALAIAPTSAFETDFTAYAQTGICKKSVASSASMSCPLGTEVQPCDFAAFGTEYTFAYTCKKTIPQCLIWSATDAKFMTESTCTAQAGYTASSVTCSCTSMGAVALGAKTEAGVVVNPAPAPASSPNAEASSTGGASAMIIGCAAAGGFVLLVCLYFACTAVRNAREKKDEKEKDLSSDPAVKTFSAKAQPEKGFARKLEI